MFKCTRMAIASHANHVCPCGEKRVTGLKGTSNYLAPSSRPFTMACHPMITFTAVVMEINRNLLALLSVTEAGFKIPVTSFAQRNRTGYIRAVSFAVGAAQEIAARSDERRI